jgi:nitroimidazol reductase NimA-like FMN-containing flavoprotein (pyridoxamine 5'-phosphate oxidase superfamily)
MNDRGDKMKSSDEYIFQEIKDILDSQRLAVMATERDGHPYSSLMAFAHTADLTTIVVATGRSTRKHMNLLGESRVSLLIDTRTNSESDFHAAAAVTVIGNASEIEDGEREKYSELYLSRHPYLNSFLQSPTTAMFKIHVRHYLIVNRFQHVMELHLTDEMDIFT